MDFKDYYKIMGLTDKATPADIKQAYRKLARKYHPDVSKEHDAEARFKELGEAYEVLSDDNKRAEYDQIKSAQASGGRRRQARTGADINGVDMSSEEASRQFSEFFESVFGAAAAGRRGTGPAGNYASGASFSQRGQDLHHRLALHLEEALQGAQRTLKLAIPRVDAHGRRHSSSKTLNVKIPSGVVAGQRIRLAGQGEPGYEGGTAGDLFLEIELSPHALFAVEGRDILLSVPVSPWEAALGAKVEVPTLTGPVSVTVPKASVSGKKLRLKGRGPGLNPSGDLIINLQVTLPPQHSEEADALYQKLADLEVSFNPRKSLEKQ